MKAFQAKPTIIICKDCGKEFNAYSNKHAYLMLSCAKTCNTSKYQPPEGWNEDIVSLAKCIKNTKRIVVRHYDRNIILLVKRYN